jgi:hypothetical protein
MVTREHDDFRTLETKYTDLQKQAELLANTTRIHAKRADEWEEKFRKEQKFSRSLQADLSELLRESRFSSRVRRVFKALYESIWTNHERRYD